MFTSPSKQIEQVKKWNKEKGWGFTDQDFEKIEATIPKQPAEGLVCVTLVPYLETVGQTFEALWEYAKKQQQDSWRWDLFKSDKDHLRLLEGIEHRPGLRWETIELGCQRGKSPVSVRKAQESPHAGILASAALHPEWIKAMDGESVPYVWAPGYEVSVPEDDGEAWQHVVIVDFSRGSRQVFVSARDRGYGGSLCSVPRLRESLALEPLDIGGSLALDTLAPSMGVSQWKNHGEAYGYWDYFTKQVEESEIAKQLKRIADAMEQGSKITNKKK